MQLSSGGYIRGIRCDITGEELFDHFTYYSMVGQLIYVDSSKHVINPGPKGTLDMDLSPKAFDELWNKVRSNLGDAKPGAVKCDLSTRYLTGKFKYWNIEITQVDVDIKETDGDQAQASVVSKENWDLKASDEEIKPMLELQRENCQKPFDENNIPKKQRSVIKIPAPDPLPGERLPELTPEEKTPEPVFDDAYPVEEAEPPPTPESLETPNIQTPSNDPDFYRRKAAEIMKKSRERKIHPASPLTPDPDIEFEPEITKKVKLPNTGSKVNIKKRHKK